LVVKIGVRTHETFFVFGIFEGIHGRANRTWSMVGEDERSDEVVRSAVSLFALHRGPSGNARFLAKFGLVGCAGSAGVAYDAREWDPETIPVLCTSSSNPAPSGLMIKCRDFRE
jgi:hypothetical protein